MRIFCTSALALLVAPALLSDTIRLRDGKEYEGEVISEDGDAYVVMVQVTKTIRDQRRIPKQDVLEIVAEKKDETAYEEIKDLVPTPERLDLEDYDARITKVEDFLKNFPDSLLADEAAAMLETLDAEREVIASGGVKFDGKLLSATERNAVAFTLDSRIAAAVMNEAIARRQWIDALRAWDHLERDFPNSRVYVEAVPKILSVMQRQLAAVTRELESFDSRLEERQTNLERVPEKDRARVQAAIEQRAADYQQLVESEREQGIRWTSLDPFEKEPLSRAKSLLESEIRRLEKVDTSTIPDGDAAWAEAWTVLNGNPTPDDAREAMTQARSARLPKPYLDMLEEKMPSN